MSKYYACTIYLCGEPKLIKAYVRAIKWKFIDDGVQTPTGATRCRAVKRLRPGIGEAMAGAMLGKAVDTLIDCGVDVIRQQIEFVVPHDFTAHAHRAARFPL